MAGTNAAGIAASTALGSALPIVGTGLGLLETGIGIVQDIKAKKRINSLLSQRKTFKTNQQVYDIVNATLNQAQGDIITRDYETDLIKQNLSTSIGAATRLGADPNVLSNLFQNSVAGIMRAGQDFHQSNTAAFSNALSAFKLLSDNKDAEYASEQDLLKDKLAAAGANLASSTGNISGGINTVLSSLSSKATGDLFKVKNQNTTSGQNDLATMLNDYFLKNQTDKRLSGEVTNEDMFNSSLNSNNLGV